SGGVFTGEGGLRQLLGALVIGLELDLEFRSDLHGVLAARGGFHGGEQVEQGLGVGGAAVNDAAAVLVLLGVDVQGVAGFVASFGQLDLEAGRDPIRAVESGVLAIEPGVGAFRLEHAAVGGAPGGEDRLVFRGGGGRV